MSLKDLPSTHFKVAVDELNQRYKLCLALCALVEEIAEVGSTTGIALSKVKIYFLQFRACIFYTKNDLSLISPAVPILFTDWIPTILIRKQSMVAHMQHCTGEYLQDGDKRKWKTNGWVLLQSEPKYLTNVSRTHKNRQEKNRSYFH